MVHRRTHNQTKRHASGENTGRWTDQEHCLFLDGLNEFGKEWKKIASMIPSRTVVQIRTHAQKYFQKIAKNRVKEGGNVSVDVLSTACNTKGPYHMDQLKNTCDTEPTVDKNWSRASSISVYNRVASSSSRHSFSSTSDEGFPSFENDLTNNGVEFFDTMAKRKFEVDPNEATLSSKKKQCMRGRTEEKLSCRQLQNFRVIPYADSGNPCLDARFASSHAKTHSPFLISPRTQTYPTDVESLISTQAEIPKRLTISTSIINNSTNFDRKSGEEDELKWLVSSMSKIEENSPTSISEFNFYQNFSDGAEEFFPTQEESLPQDDPSDTECCVSPGIDHTIRDKVSQCNAQKMPRGEWSLDDDDDTSENTDLVSANDACDLEHQPDLAEMGPLTKFVFEENDLDWHSLPLN